MSERRFKLLWRALPKARRKDVYRLALLGRRAADPETAWLVTKPTRNHLRFWGVPAFFMTAVIALVVWVVVHRGWSWALVLTQVPAACCWILVNVVSLQYRRALRLNEPIARAPGAE